MHRLALCFLLTACGLRAQTTPAALDWDARWDNYMQTYDWKKIGAVAAENAFDQTFQLKKCGRPPYCFPHDFGGSIVRRTARNTIELGVGALLHEDLRRRPSGLTGFGRRVSYALLHAPLARGRDGNWEPAYGRFAGTFGGVVVTSAWEGRPLNASQLGEAFGWAASYYFQDALLTEFEPDMDRLARKFTNKFRRH